MIQINKKYLERVKYIITRTIRAVKDDLLCINNNNNCYQYIAFDLHLENLQNSQNIAGLNDVNRIPVPVPWLLEVNATPGLKSPNYQWQNVGGLQNFLESILNITVGTKIPRGHKQLFEYLPYRQKINGFGIEEIPFTN